METTIPSATVELRGGDRIILKHATTDHILEIYRAVTATRYASTNETDSSEDSTTKVQSVKNAKRREIRQTLTASRKAEATTARESGAEPTSTEEADDRATIAPHPSTEEDDDPTVVPHPVRHPSYDLAAATRANLRNLAAAVLAEDDVDDVETESMDEAENIEMDKAAMEESLFNAIAAHDPEFKLAEHRTKNKKKNNKKKNR
jgi:hypothetical protein